VTIQSSREESRNYRGFGVGRGTITQRSQRKEHGGHRERRREEKEGEKIAQRTQKAQMTQSSQRRGSVTPDRKSPPFAEEREGWGTLKFKGGVAWGEEPKTRAHTPCLGHPAQMK